MNLLTIILTVVALCLFEIITSIDNAVINAEVLSGMSDRGRRWFLLWGFLFAVVVVRGLLPLIIVWLANPNQGIFDVLTMTFSGGEAAKLAVEQSAPILLSGGGTFLIFLFMSWL